MRHQVFGKKLNRDIKERKALFRSLVISLITYEKIKTTLAKAKAIRPLAEKLVTKAKEGTDSALRQVASFLTRKEAINKLLNDIAPRFNQTFGGYLRIRRVGKRKSDAVEEVILEWTKQKEKESPPTGVKKEKVKSKKVKKEVKKTRKSKKKL